LGRNPATGERIRIKASKKAVFRARRTSRKQSNFAWRVTLGPSLAREVARRGGSVTAGELVAASANIVRFEVWYSSRHQRRAAVAKGVEIEIAPLDEAHVEQRSLGLSKMSVAGNSL